MIRYGKQIGKKFNKDGSTGIFVGNTVVADIQKDTESMDILCEIGKAIKDHAPEDAYILLPSESYHMTLFRGINDQVREPGFWPPDLDISSAFVKADDYFQNRLEGVKLPSDIRMKFKDIVFDEEDVHVVLVPVDTAEEEKLKVYRDQAADSLGFRQPGHDKYTYHVTLAYYVGYESIEREAENKDLSCDTCLYMEDSREESDRQAYGKDEQF